MNSWIGWTLAGLFALIAWQQYGWQGLIFAATVIVFWLLLQFNKAMRVMRLAGSSPVGLVDSAVMFNAWLKPGLQMMRVLTYTRSLGNKLGDTPERYRWTDAGGSHVTVEMRDGKVATWSLWRPDQAEPQAGGGAAPATLPPAA